MSLDGEISIKEHSQDLRMKQPTLNVQSKLKTEGKKQGRDFSLKWEIAKKKPDPRRGQDSVIYAESVEHHGSSSQDLVDKKQDLKVQT